MSEGNPITKREMRQMLEEIKKLDFIHDIKRENEKLKEKTAELEEKVRDLEAYSRRNNLVVYGILLQEDENPIQLAINIGKIAGID